MKSEELEINILALRKIADTLLQQVRADKKSASAKGRKKKVISMADLKSRVLTGGMKPAALKNKAP